MSATDNGCPICAGAGELMAIGTVPIVVPCPECAGLAITPASADDAIALSNETPVVAA